MSEPTLEEAVKRVQKALIENEEYRHVIACGIAMSIYDTQHPQGVTAHEWRNRCAQTFIKNFVSNHPDTPDLAELPGMMAAGYIPGYFDKPGTGKE